MWPLRGYILLSVLSEKSIQCTVYRVFEDPNPNDLLKIRKVLYGDGQERVNLFNIYFCSAIYGYNFCRAALKAMQLLVRKKLFKIN